MGNPDDIHNFPKRYENALQQLEKSDISQRNKELILKFGKSCKRKGNKISTIAMNLNILRWIAIAIQKDLDSLTEDDFDIFLDRLEVQGKDNSGYKKAIKKFFRFQTDDNPPKWIRELRLPQHDSPVQPADLLTTAELDILLNACKHPRDKAFIATLLDSCMRIGAIGTLRIKGVESNQCGGVLYMSPTSRNQKSTSSKPFPITWSMGYLNAWLDVHPDKNNPEAALWVSLKGDIISAMTYPGLVMVLKRVLKRTGLTKKVHYHLFKHQKVTEMILKGYSDREIRFQAGWSPNSNHMFKIYGNFYDKDMVDSIYIRAGLSPQNKKIVTLSKCPRCHVVLVPEARVCHQCALILDASLDKERQVIEEDVAEKALLKLMENPKVMAMFKEMVNK
ncbi:MAG: site-specific integrase [Candidatus Methanoperedens sp.]|nr:site-specific integrase [Candidatus Methanoperedens sp.]MCZ7359774.1 site-specific integrase [Candidatus Methanoperedens sp.]